MSLNASLKEATITFVEERSGSTREEILIHLFDVCGDEIAVEDDRRKRDWVWNIVSGAFKGAVRQHGKQDAQQARLPGFPPPPVIGVQSESGDEGQVRYIAFGSATWSDLKGQRALKITNIINAQDVLDDWDRKLDVLRPYMEAHPDRTVDEALSLMDTTA